jgi:hypothetical protein
MLIQRNCDAFPNSVKINNNAKPPLKYVAWEKKNYINSSEKKTFFYNNGKKK